MIKREFLALSIALLCLGWVTGVKAATQTVPVRFKASDGVVVYGNYRAVSPSAPLLLLFHQAGSSKDEYATIAPVLNQNGYSTLAIDQRAGGPLFGVNQTMAHAPHVTRTDPQAYLAALPDLNAALAWAQAHHRGKIAVWGSSYSSSLVFLLAAKHPEISAVLSFSPDEYFDDTHLVRRAAARLHMPIFVDSAADPQEIAAARSILSAAAAKTKVQYVPVAGVHGSSTLIAARDPRGATQNWKAVLEFLRSNFPR